MASDDSAFPEIHFNGTLRPSQKEVVDIARKKLAAGRRRLHIVAPPGSGKTVLGLYLWATCIRQPALVLSPNSAIQAQWAARTDLFSLPNNQNQSVSTDPQQPGLLTSLTYQSVTLPSRGDRDFDVAATALWQQALIDKEQALNTLEAMIWIEDLRKHNRAYYDERLSIYRKQLRDEMALGGEALETLHRSSLATLRRLRDRGIGMIILDECHHLMGHWGRVLSDAQEMLDNPLVIGLTATPPDRDGRKAEDIERYDQYFGEIDFEVPVPAVVKDGFLAPYQDLAYFVRPTSEELAFVANADHQLEQLIQELCTTDLTAEAVGTDHVAPSSLNNTSPASAGMSPLGFEPIQTWVSRALSEHRLPTGPMQDWKSFARRDPDFALMGRLFLLHLGMSLPKRVPELLLEMPLEEFPKIEIFRSVVDRYVRHYLRRSPREADHQRAEKAIRRLRTLGIQITATGSQACASPVGRVMAYSRSKALALPTILKTESRDLGDDLRAVVVADYEKTSAISAEVQHLLDTEAGGAVAAFKAILNDEQTDKLDPILITGSSVLVDDDLSSKFQAAATEWLQAGGYQVELQLGQEEGFHSINGRGGDWCPRVYIEMITDLFQRGITKCLVGTRGLLGEGWDANKINVLIDLTTVTTSMTVNQLRGRSIRLDPNVPEKLANNWDVVCIAPEFSKGLDDYRRFITKHKALYGVTDDGAIEKGVGHVHAALTELRPEGVEESARLLNEDMLGRVGQRTVVRQKWRIGEPYQDHPILALETKLTPAQGDFPPFVGVAEPWCGHSLATAIGTAVLHALRSTNLIQDLLPLQVGARSGGYVRLFLEHADDKESQVFATAMHEALGPLHRPRYVIPRYVDHLKATWLSSFLPEIIGKYFRQRERLRVMLHAVPTILAKNRDTVLVYQKYWNELVSPGDAVYAHRGEGELLVEEAKAHQQTPSHQIREKEIFL